MQSPRNKDGTTRKRHRQRKRTLNLGTWNVQGINTKQAEVFTQLEKYGIDIGTLTEVKKKELEMENKDHTFYFIVELPRKKEQGLVLLYLYTRNSRKTLRAGKKLMNA